MNRKQYTLTVVLALIAGLIGGMVSSQFFVGRPVFAKNKERKIIEANEFRVLDGKGRLRAVLREVPGKVKTVWDMEKNKKVDVTVPCDVELVMYDEYGNEVNEWDEYELKTHFINTQNLCIHDPMEKRRIYLGTVPGPVIELCDKTGKQRTVIGCVDLNVISTGEARKRSESSLVLFGKDGKVIWSAP